jgi:hypothetical protein
VIEERFAAWLDRQEGDQPVDPAVTAAVTLREGRAAGEV